MNQFCLQIKKNRVAIVVYDTDVTISTNFTNNLSTLSNSINSMDGQGSWTNITSGVKQADAFLQASNASVKNLVIMTDGVPTAGPIITTGKYSYSDYTNKHNATYYSYQYANALYELVSSLFNQYSVYTFGFFHNVTYYTKAFASKVLNDTQNVGYYEVTDPSDLEFTFNEIADDISDNENYVFHYKDVAYVSSAYNDFSDNNKWQTIEETTINSGKFNWANAVVSAISVNDGSDDALNVDVNNESAIFKLNIAGSIISMLHGFVTGGREGVTNVKLKLQTNGVNNRMLLMYGNPIETVYGGKTLWLSDILTKAHSGEAAYFLSADEDQDKIIRNVFKGLKKGGKYSMKITFSKKKDYEDSPYRYSIVIANNQKVYQYPILHNATKMEVYYKPKGGKKKFAFDATQLINSEKRELQEQIGKDIIDFLNSGDWKKKAKPQTIKVTANYKKELGNKPFSLKAKAKTSLSYVSKNKKVATVDSKGKVTIKNIGTVVIQIIATGTKKYDKDIKSVVITVNPKSTQITKINRDSTKTAIIKWKKSTDADGYVIQFSAKSNMSNVVNRTIKGKQRVSAKINNLRKGQKYYVRIQTFKRVSGKTYYSKWSSKKTIIKK